MTFIRSMNDFRQLANKSPFVTGTYLSLLCIAFVSIYIWDYPEWNTLRFQSFLIISWSALATIAPLLHLMRTSPTAANILTLHFSLPFLLAIWPPALFVLLNDKKIEEFPKIFFPVYGIVIIITVMEYVLITNELFRSRNILEHKDKFQLLYTVFSGVILLGSLTFSLPYVEDLDELLTNTVKKNLFYAGYYLSTFFSIAGLYLYNWIETNSNLSSPTVNNDEDTYS